MTIKVRVCFCIVRHWIKMCKNCWMKQFKMKLFCFVAEIFNILSFGNVIIFIILKYGKNEIINYHSYDEKIFEKFTNV